MKINLNDVIFDSAMLYYDTTLDIETNIATLETYLTGKELGLSDGGVSFSSTPEVRQIPIAGSLGKKIKGFERIIKVDGKVEGEIVVLNGKMLEMSLYKKGTTEAAKHDKYIPETGVVADGSYGDLLLVGETCGESVLVLIKNTYNEALTLDTKDKEEGKVKVSFEGRYDKESKVPPIEIWVPKAV